MDASMVLAAASLALPAGATVALTIALVAAVARAREIQPRPAMAFLAFRRAS